jgi:hypothetical protein
MEGNGASFMQNHIPQSLAETLKTTLKRKSLWYRLDTPSVLEQKRQITDEVIGDWFRERLLNQLKEEEEEKKRQLLFQRLSKAPEDYTSCQPEVLISDLIT